MGSKIPCHGAVLVDVGIGKRATVTTGESGIKIQQRRCEERGILRLEAVEENNMLRDLAHLKRREVTLHNGGGAPDKEGTILVEYLGDNA